MQSGGGLKKWRMLRFRGQVHRWINSVSTMDEIIPEIEEDIPANEYGDIQNELSLESVIEDENEDDDEDKDDDDR
ncbi:MAG: hypothetical protein ACLUE8_05675 [Lachnospiraceae bacterium]